MHGSLPARADFVVIGAGIIGVCVALELRRRHPRSSVVVLEKEAGAGEHASGRNSGVLHAGFYYDSDSLKARLARDGNRRLREWCDEREIAVRRCGKLVVAKSESDHPRLDELLRRAHINGVPLEPVDEDEARRIEPHARTVGRALYSPTTSSVDPAAVMAEMVAECTRDGVAIHTDTAWLERRGNTVRTSRGSVDAGFLVNAAGAHAVAIAQSCGFGHRYGVLPFKGLYLHANASAPPLRTHVYPVPDLGMPFLGVHCTVAADGSIKIGPTAMPALWLESYEPALSVRALERFDAAELMGVARHGIALFLANGAVRRHARAELPKTVRRALVREASLLVPHMLDEHFDRWGRAGIRAQLLDVEQKSLVMDFVLEGDGRSVHLLNAVSPGFTCALAFADVVADAVGGDRSS